MENAACQSEIRIVHFDDLTLKELHAIYRVRSEVFVVGQGICAVSDVDDLDLQCWHVLLTVEGRLIGTARLIGHGDQAIKVGRLAVLESCRGRGYGKAIMGAIHHWIGGRQGVMSAQAYLEAWYTSLGWQTVSEVYQEAGVDHVEMRYAPA